MSEVFAYSADPQWLGKPFITMKYITGRQSLGRHISGHYYENHVRDTITWFTRLMVELHRMDYHPFLWLVPDSSDDPAALLQRKLTDGRQLVIDQFQQMWAIPIFDWLEARLADVQKTASLSVIHNDFHIWNVMMAKGKAYVIDWSLIEVNDYRFDLGWTLLLTATNRSLEERDLILSEYDRWANHDVEHIEYFEVVAALRRLFDLAASLGSGAESSGMRPETVEIMRRQRDHYQQVYDLLRKITGLTLPEIERQISSLGT